MNKTKINFIIMSLILIILSFGAYANVIWTDFGGGRTDDLMFSSLYQNGDTNFTVVIETVSNEYYPHVASSLDFENDHYIYQYGDSEIRIYDAQTLSLISNTILAIDIIGQPMITNVDDANNLDLVFVTDNTTNKFINFYTMTNGVDLEELKVFEIDNFATGQLAVPKTFCSDGDGICDGVTIAGLLYNDSFITIDYDTSTYDVHSHGMTYVGFPSGNFFRSDYPYYSSPIYMDDVTGDSEEEIIIGAVVSSANIQVKMFDLDGAEIQDSGIKTGTYTGGDVITVVTAQIGSLTGSKEILVSVDNTQLIKGGLIIFDSSLNELHRATTSNSRGQISVGDVNIDGLNEACYNEFNRIKCFDSTFTNIFNITVDGNEYRFITLAQYDNTTNYLEILTTSEIYKRNNTNQDVIYNFTSVDKNAMIYPIELIERDTSLVKDLLYTSGTEIRAYYSSTTGAVCGDFQCSIFETILTCPEDCLVINKQDTGTRCSSNDDCNSGFCTNLRCALKSEGVSCDNGNECTSGICNQFDVCTIPTTANKISAIKAENGMDSGMADLVGLFIALGMAVFIFFLGLAVGGDHLHGIIWASMGGFFITTGALTIVEFMRPFLLLGEIILGFIVLAVVLITGGGNK